MKNNKFACLQQIHFFVFQCLQIGIKTSLLCYSVFKIKRDELNLKTV